MAIPFAGLFILSGACGLTYQVDGMRIQEIHEEYGTLHSAKAACNA